MVKESAPDEIVLDDIMKESMKDIGKGESVPSREETVPVESQKEVVVKPQFGFKLGPVQTREDFVVAPKKEEDVPKKKQVILDKPSQSMDDDIIVEW